MTEAAFARSRPRAALAGATLLQAVPAVANDRLGRALLDLVVAAVRSGARALVAGGGGPLVGELQALGGEWTEFDFLSTRPLAHRRAVAALRELIRAERVDVVHAHGPDAAACALAARARSDGPKLVTAFIGAPPAGRSWRPSRHEAAARGDRVLAFSQFAAGLIAERYGTPLGRFAIVPPAIDAALFDPAAVGPERVAALRRAWRVGADDVLILAPGRLVSSEGFITLVDAMRLLANGGLRGAVAVIAAQGGTDEDVGPLLDERIEKQGLADAVRRVGICPDMPAALRAADLVVIPTERASTFNMLAAEAQAMGRPVVASDLGALPEMLAAGMAQERTGWIAAPGDPFALAQALAAALSLPAQEREAIRRRARGAAERRFTPAQVAKATLAVYANLLNDRE